MLSSRLLYVIFSVLIFINTAALFGQKLRINNKGYFERRGLNVIVYDDIYPEGHQGGVTIIQHGRRVAANGNLYLQPVPGQWAPYPRYLDKEIIKEKNEIAASLMYPDSTRIKYKGQPYIYPDLKLTYKVRVIGEGKNFKIILDLDKALPEKWAGKAGFNIELFPGNLFGKAYLMDEQGGVFPYYTASPVAAGNQYDAQPMAEGKSLTVAPEDDYFRLKITTEKGKLQLIDGRTVHNNGWFIVRTPIPAGVTKNALVWTFEVNTVDNWLYTPVIHLSQVGYHPNQTKAAVIELDRNDHDVKPIKINKLMPDGQSRTVMTINEKQKREFLRFDYLKADFSALKEPGIYVVQYGDVVSQPFKIDAQIYKSGVWQPTLEYFLPVQMCHMKVFEKYRVWHDYCHLDDALMAPQDIWHFDGYTHGKVPEGFKPLKHVDGLNKGGWHDAGDYDFRIESQVGTVLTLVYAYEAFDIRDDQTLINQTDGIVEIHHPDGKPDILQQIEHGLLTILGGYRQFGKFYRGIITPTLRQYVLLGDARSMTDNKVFRGEVKNEYHGFWYTHIANKYNRYFSPRETELSGREYIKDLDDRLVFLDENAGRQIYGIAGLAAASRVMRDYNDKLADECLTAAENLWQIYKSAHGKRVDAQKVHALAELILTTNKKTYKDDLRAMLPLVLKNIEASGWTLGRVLPLMEDKNFVKAVNKEMAVVEKDVEKASNENPFGIPYHPHIWGAGWGIQKFGFIQYFLYKGWPHIFSKEPILNALNFVLGCHPGENSASFASNVGARSQIVAYGVNRADWSFIPGGVISGTNLVRPDLPELLKWPYLWQQGEYVMGGGATNFMFLVLAADDVLNEK